MIEKFKDSLIKQIDGSELNKIY